MLLGETRTESGKQLTEHPLEHVVDYALFLRGLRGRLSGLFLARRFAENEKDENNKFTEKRS